MSANRYINGPTNGMAAISARTILNKSESTEREMCHQHQVLPTTESAIAIYVKAISAFKVCYRPILLKNSFSTDRETIPAVIGCDARFKLRGYVEDAMWRRKAS